MADSPNKKPQLDSWKVMLVVLSAYALAAAFALKFTLGWTLFRPANVVLGTWQLPSGLFFFIMLAFGLAVGVLGIALAVLSHRLRWVFAAVGAICGASSMAFPFLEHVYNPPIDFSPTLSTTGDLAGQWADSECQLTLRSDGTFQMVAGRKSFAGLRSSEAGGTWAMVANSSDCYRNLSLLDTVQHREFDLCVMACNGRLFIGEAVPVDPDCWDGHLGLSKTGHTLHE